MKTQPVPQARQRLSDKQVREIRQKSVRGSSDLELAEAYGVHFSWIHRIRRGEVRKDAGGPLRLDPVDWHDRHSTVLTEPKVRRILTAYDKLDREGRRTTTYAELAEKYGVSISTISAICNGRKWRHVFEEYYGPLSV